MKKTIFIGILLIACLCPKFSAVSAGWAETIPPRFWDKAEWVSDDVEYANKLFRDVTENSDTNLDEEQKPKEFIKWMDFRVSETILKEVYFLDLKYHRTDIDFKLINVLAYLTALNGNQFKIKTDKANLSKLVSKLEKKEKMDELAKDMKYYPHYVECYRAVFGGLLGEYTVEHAEDKKSEYGLLMYYPIAKGFAVHDYDDFGASRSYGYKRKHLGHDMFGSTGTPVVAVEGGEITELQWNRYGGWTISIRSTDQKRIYYYAHLRKNSPYAEGLKLGDTVQAGQVIGYIGRTGYSTKENSNMECESHLHIGMQLVFDESQVRGPRAIWIDMYNITKLLNFNTAKTERNPETKQYKSLHLRVPAEND